MTQGTMNRKINKNYNFTAFIATTYQCLNGSPSHFLTHLFHLNALLSSKQLGANQMSNVDISTTECIFYA